VVKLVIWFNVKQLELCKDCPASAWIPEVIKQLKAKEVIKTGEKPSALKICMELRKIIRELGLNSCPYYYQTETLLIWQKAKPHAYNSEG
jgi:hypothetical protein